MYNEARAQQSGGLSTDEYEKFKMVFLRYVSELPNSKFATAEGGDGAGAAEAPEEPSQKAQEKLRNLRAMVEDGEMTDAEFDAKKSAILKADKARAATAGPAPTIHVGEELRGLCALLGIEMTFRQWEIVEHGDVYQPRMDIHSFLCFVAVRLGRVSAGGDGLVPGLPI